MFSGYCQCTISSLLHLLGSILIVAKSKISTNSIMATIFRLQFFLVPVRCACNVCKIFCCEIQPKMVLAQNSLSLSRSQIARCVQKYILNRFIKIVIKLKCQCWRRNLIPLWCTMCCIGWIHAQAKCTHTKTHTHMRRMETKIHERLALIHCPCCNGSAMQKQRNVFLIKLIRFVGFICRLRLHRKQKMHHAEALQRMREEDATRKRMKINFTMEIALSSHREILSEVPE